MKYIYGAGKMARRVISRMTLNGELDSVDGVLVSNKEGNPDELQGIPVRTLDSLREEERQERVVYIGVSNDFRHEVEKDLISRGLTNIEYPNLSSLKIHLKFK